MNFTIKKSKSMRISRKKKNILTHDSSLESVSEFKDLGEIVKHNLSWNSHIDRNSQQTVRANFANM